MNRHLLLFIAVFFLLVSWFIKWYDHMRIWITQLRSQLSVAKRKRKNKSSPCSCHQRPECPLCQADISSQHLIFANFPALTARFWTTDAFWVEVYHQHHRSPEIRRWVDDFGQEWGYMDRPYHIQIKCGCVVMPSTQGGRNTILGSHRSTFLLHGIFRSCQG